MTAQITPTRQPLDSHSRPTVNITVTYCTRIAIMLNP